MKFIGLNIFLLVSGLLFMIGLIGIVLNRRHLITLFMCLEILLLSVNMNFVFFSAFLKDMVGQVFSLFILTVAACETAIGLAILVTYYRLLQNISVEKLRHIYNPAPQDTFIDPAEVQT